MIISAKDIPSKIEGASDEMLPRRMSAWMWDVIAACDGELSIVQIATDLKLEDWVVREFVAELVWNHVVRLQLLTQAEYIERGPGLDVAVAPVAIIASEPVIAAVEPAAVLVAEVQIEAAEAEIVNPESLTPPPSRETEGIPVAAPISVVIPEPAPSSGNMSAADRILEMRNRVTALRGGSATPASAPEPTPVARPTLTVVADKPAEPSAQTAGIAFNMEAEPKAAAPENGDVVAISFG